MSGTKRKSSYESKTTKKNKYNPEGVLVALMESPDVMKEWKKANLVDVALALPGFREAMTEGYASAMERLDEKKKETDYSAFKGHFLDGFLLSVNLIQFLLGKEISIPNLKYIRNKLRDGEDDTSWDDLSIEEVFFGAFKDDFKLHTMTDTEEFKKKFFEFFIGSNVLKREGNLEAIRTKVNESEDIDLGQFDMNLRVFVESQPRFRNMLLEYFRQVILNENVDMQEADDDFSAAYNEGFEFCYSVEMLARVIQRYFVEDEDDYTYGCSWDTDEDYGEMSMDAVFFHGVLNWDEFRTSLMTKISDQLKETI